MCSIRAPALECAVRLRPMLFTYSDELFQFSNLLIRVSKIIAEERKMKPGNLILVGTTRLL